MSIHSEDSHKPRAGTYPPFGDNLEGNLPEEDGVEQRAEPPSWLPDNGQSRTGAAADLRTPEADEAAAGTPDGDTEYNFSGSTSYSDSQDTTFGQTGAAVGGYSYDPGSPADTTSAVPPYPASLTEPAGPAKTSTPSSTNSTSTNSATKGKTSTGKTGAGQASPSLSPGAAGDGPTAPVKENSRNRTSTFSAVSRGRYKPGSGTSAGASAAVGAKAGSQAPARRADLVISRLEPWSVMKFSFLMSLVAWVVLFVAVAFLYFVLSSLGVFTSIEHTLGSVTSSSGSSAGSSISHWFAASRILGYTMLLGAVNIVLITALSTIGSMIYNLVTHLGGGIEVTLRETD
jgi:Transmembrane domain of unknown function (DUF3566)